MTRLALAALLVVSGAVARAGDAHGDGDGGGVSHTWIHVGDLGRLQCGSAPAGWQLPGFDDGGWSLTAIKSERVYGQASPAVPGEAPSCHIATAAAPDGGTHAVAAPGNVAPPGAVVALSDGGASDDGAHRCGGARFVRLRFTVAASELRSLRTLTLRIRYASGFAAYVDGRELARRRLDPDASPQTLATDLHGPELESFVVPASSWLHAGENLLAVEVHPRMAGKNSSVELSLGGDDGPRFVRGPYLVGVNETVATIVADTDLPTTLQLDWGPSARYGNTQHDGLTLHHVLHLAHLQPGAQLHYRVIARVDGSERHARDARFAVASDDAAFHTPPDAGRPLRFAVYGDVRSGHDVHAILVRSLIDEQPDFALVNGDLVDRGSDEGDWEQFFAVAAPLLARLSIYPVPGNHEYAKQGRGLITFLQLFRWPIAPADEPPWYSFDVAGAHFVALDSTQYKSQKQLGWFEHDLAAARKRRARAIFVYAHEGPASAGLHGDSAVCVRDYQPLMERYRVDMFFGGHDHDYERGRSGQLDYVVTGGGGAELRASRCDVPGKPRCPARTAIFVNDHNYVMVELLPSLFRVCPKRVDGSAIEPCVQYPLKP